MTIEPVSAAAAAATTAAASANLPRSPTSGFEAWMTNAVGETNTKIAEADRLAQKLALGETDNLHQVMIALEEARMSFQLLVQVRNKLLEGYQELLRMQV